MYLTSLVCLFVVVVVVVVFFNETIDFSWFQTYRHVDNLMFENPFMFDRFLDYWRKTGNQRIGFLYGKYEHHKDVPLGIKATVSAIYEPPQVKCFWFVKILSGYCIPNKKISMFCVLSQNHQHLFTKMIYVSYCKLSKELKNGMEMSKYCFDH